MKGFYKKMLLLLGAAFLIISLKDSYMVRADEGASFYHYRSVLANSENGENLAGAYDAIYLAVKNYPESVKSGKTPAAYLLDFGLSSEDIIVVRNAIVGDHPECFWFTGGASVSQISVNGGDPVVKECKIKSPFTNEELPSCISAFNKKVDKILSATSSLSSDYEKEKYIHDAICASVEYVSGSPFNQSAYSALVLGESVCAGYAKAFQLLLQKNGVKSMFVTGSAESSTDANHAWTIARIGGKYYQADVTWDDPSFVNTDYLTVNEHDVSANYYTYFNLTDNMMYETHTLTDPNVNAYYSFYAGLPECNSTEMNYYRKNAAEGRLLYVDSSAGSLSVSDLLFALENPIDDACRIFVENKKELKKVHSSFEDNGDEICQGLGINGTYYFFPWRSNDNELIIYLLTKDNSVIHGNAALSEKESLKIAIVDSSGNAVFSKNISGLGASYAAYFTADGEYTVCAFDGDRIVFEKTLKLEEKAGEYRYVECDIVPDKKHVHTHLWDDGEVLAEAGADTEEKIVYKCLKCGEQKTETVDVTETDDPSEAAISELSDGKLYYTIGGVVQSSYTGYANINGDTRSLYQYKIVKGAVDTSYEGLYKVDGVWRYYRDGKFQDTTTGFATDMTRFYASGRKQIYRYRVEKGLINFHFNGFAETNNARYYKDGRWMNTYTGYANNTQGLLGEYEYYVRNGAVDEDYEGLYKVDGVWRYYRYGKFQATTTGFATDMTRFYASGRKQIYRYRIEKGLINFHFTAIADTGRYYLDGRWMNTFSGTVNIDDAEIYIENGKVIQDLNTDGAE